MSEQHYDVIIIGGRYAGASLAIRLGQQQIKTLVVDRASFPSLPAVPSSPIAHPGTMRLIDELGIPESAYGLEGSKVDHYVLDFVNYFHAPIPTSLLQLDRNYVRGIDRTVLDTLVWQRAQTTPNVTALDRFAATRIIKDSTGRVTGMAGKQIDSGTETVYSANLVVGADGRFSFAAKEFDAPIIEEYAENPTASYHAEWENVDDYSPELGHTITVYNTTNSLLVLCIPIAARKYILALYVPSKDADFGAGGLEAFYEKTLQSIPHLAQRMRNARKVTDVVGVKRITNGYRQGTGAGWALVGDALHYKDPLDGQGIYDALIEAKLLAKAIVHWKCDGVTWEQATAEYAAGVQAETHAMFLQTVMRVKQEMFTKTPAFLIKTYVRWLLNDPEYQTQFLRYLSRAIPPESFSVKPSISPKVVQRGLANDLQKRFFGSRLKLSGEANK